MSQLGTNKLTLKLFASTARLPPMHAFIEVFHAYIKAEKLPEPMIDVTDYGHVHEGPSVFFCGHESDYVIDGADGRVGLLYRRKRARDPEPTVGAADAHLADATKRLFEVATWLAEEPMLRGLAFDQDELLITLTDRLRTPNDEATFERVAPIIAATLAPRLGSVSLERDLRDERRPLTIRARTR